MPNCSDSDKPRLPGVRVKLEMRGLPRYAMLQEGGVVRHGIAYQLARIQDTVGVVGLSGSGHRVKASGHACVNPDAHVRVVVQECYQFGDLLDSRGRVVRALDDLGGPDAVGVPQPARSRTRP
jgi:hypothetical protein